MAEPTLGFATFMSSATPGGDVAPIKILYVEDDPRLAKLKTAPSARARP